MPSLRVDAKELITRLAKVLFEGLIVAVAAFLIPSKGKISPAEILYLGAVAAATFSILDLFAPSVAGTVRNGAGFAVGSNLVGGLHLGK